MSNRINVSLFVTVLFLAIFTNCTDHKSQTFHADIAGKGELVVAMDTDMPGFFAVNGEQYGYHYDMLQAYAERLGVKLRIITGYPHAECARMLLGGEVDIVASLRPDTGVEGAQSVPIYTTSYVLLAGPRCSQPLRNGVFNADPERFDDAGVLICSGFKSSKYYGPLVDSLAGARKFITETGGMDAARALVTGGYDYLVCEKSEARMACGMYPSLACIAEFGDEVPVSVSLSPGVRGLKDDFGTWLAEYRTSEEYDMLDYRYFDRPAMAARGGAGGNSGAAANGISQFDDVIRLVAQREGQDWRLLSAIAYHESRFKPHVESPKGAKGIMQIMPVVARHFGVEQDKIADTETNVMLAAKLLKNIEGSIKLPGSVAYHDRMSIVLACYNAGVGHIADARRLAKKYGYNPNSWTGVAHCLQLKSQPEYYSDEVVRNGIFRGSKQTLAFVNNVMGQYDSYCLVAQN